MSAITATPFSAIRDMAEEGTLDGARVRSADHPDTIGEVTVTPMMHLHVRWTDNPYYDRRLRDYIASSEWDMLELMIRDSRGEDVTLPLIFEAA